MIRMVFSSDVNMTKTILAMLVLVLLSVMTLPASGEVSSAVYQSTGWTFFPAVLAVALTVAFKSLKDRRQKFEKEYHIKAELSGIEHDLGIGGTPKPIEPVYGAGYVREGDLFGEHSTEVLFWYKGFEEYNKRFEALKENGDHKGILRLQHSKKNEMGGILSSYWLKRIPDSGSDLSTSKFIRYLLRRDAKEEPTNPSLWKLLQSQLNRRRRRRSGGR